MEVYLYKYAMWMELSVNIHEGKGKSTQNGQKSADFVPSYYNVVQEDEFLPQKNETNKSQH